MNQMVRIPRALMALLFAVPMLAACKDDTIDGVYAATTFTVGSPGSTAKDALAAGASIHLNIGKDYSTSGSMSIPPSITGDGTTFSVGLLGTASIQGDTVRLDLVQDSFLRDMAFIFDGSSLSGSGTFDGTTVVVKLSK